MPRRAGPNLSGDPAVDGAIQAPPTSTCAGQILTTQRGMASDGTGRTGPQGGMPGRRVVPPRSSDARPRRRVAAHLCGSACKAGTRQRPRTRLGPARGSLGATRQLRLRHDRLVGSEDFLLRLAVEQSDELVTLDRLAAEQDLRRLAQVVAVL